VPERLPGHRLGSIPPASPVIDADALALDEDDEGAD
jgi:hypothetical protein